MKRIDHSEASSKFIEAKDHIEFHDKRLWDLRKKRDRESEHLPEWEELRSLASAIKEHTLTHLADYLEEFERNATRNGAQVHWARDAAEHNQIVFDIMSSKAARTLVKAKSMLTDECEMRPFLEARGIEIMETDLGERIQQLDDEPPSHIVVPAVHKLRGDVARVFAENIGTDPDNSDIHYLAESQRQHTRPYFLKAEAGMTGANFAVAETGTVVVCTNEGNADLSVNLPKLYIASIGIEKVIPRIEHLAVFVRMLSRSALGSPITQLTSHFRAPRDGAEMHIILVDNGRAERLGMADFWYSLKCIRCGACMNTCPVYRRSGGLSYGATYSGPIGVIIDPTFNLRKYSSLPFASTLNGSCTSVCPVKINIHEQIYKWRQIIAERHQLPFVKQEAMQMAGKVLASPKLYRAAVEVAGATVEHLPRFMMYNPLNAWGRQREVPAAPKSTFRQWYLKNRGKAMNSREDILARIRKNQPAPQELPEVPTFDAAAAAPPIESFKAGVIRMGGKVVDPSPDGLDALIKQLFPDAKVVCSAVSEVAGNRPLDRVAAPADLHDVDVGVVRAVFGVAETGSLWLTEAQFKVNTLGFLAQHLVVLLDPTKIVGNMHHAYRERANFDARYGVFMTGPSATADIEGVLIHGAQGIRTLTVVPLAEPLL